MRGLLFDLQDFVSRHLAQAPQELFVLKLTAAEELILMRATKADVGEDLASRILVDGPRCAFPKLFGVEVIWGAPNRSIAPARHQDKPE